MTLLTEGLHAGGFLVSEANGLRSRDEVVVLSGQNLLAGAVIGRGGMSSGAAPNPVVSGTGNGTMTNVRPGADVQSGSYIVKLKTVVAHGGVFSVTAPDETVLPDFTLTPGAGGSTNYTSSHLRFTITDGSTDFALNDQFTVAVTSGGTPAVVGTGNGVMSAISLGPQAQTGTYRIQNTSAVTNGGVFSVVAPNGSALASFTMTAGAGLTTAYESDHVNFSLTDGSTDFALGDYFHIGVIDGANKVAAWTPGAADGTEDVAGILFDAVDATAGDQRGVIFARDCVINWNEVAWGASVTAAQKVSARAALAALGVVASDERGRRT